MVVTKYQKRISGPLLDRIDIHIEVPRVEYEKLSDDRYGESSQAIRARVEAARALQHERFHSPGAREPGVRNPIIPRAAPPKGAIGDQISDSISSNADMRPAEVRKHCALDPTGQALMKSAMNQLQLSARAYHRLLKLARTIADPAGSGSIQPAHLAESLQYRPRLGLMG